MFRSIQMMQFFLRTGWGDSSTSIGGDILHILHGMCQGNGASSAAWLDLSTVLVRIYKQKGNGAQIQSPITHCIMDTMGVLFLDDVDLFIMQACIDSELNLHGECQVSLNTWGRSLIGSGGMLKPEKCHYYMWDFECKDGEWEYVDLRDHPALEVPGAAGKSTPIEQLSVSNN